MFTGNYHNYRPRTEYDGRLCFYRCLSVNRGYPIQVPMGGGGTPRYLPLWPDPDGGGRGYLLPWPRYLPPGQVQMGEGYPKVPTPWPGPDGGRGYPKVPTPPHPSQGTYCPHPSRSRWGEGVAKGTYPPSQGTYPPPVQVQMEGGGSQRYLPSPGQGTYPTVQIQMGGTSRYLPLSRSRWG